MYVELIFQPDNQSAEKTSTYLRREINIRDQEFVKLDGNKLDRDQFH